MRLLPPLQELMEIIEAFFQLFAFLDQTEVAKMIEIGPNLRDLLGGLSIAGAFIFTILMMARASK